MGHTQLAVCSETSIASSNVLPVSGDGATTTTQLFPIHREDGAAATLQLPSTQLFPIHKEEGAAATLQLPSTPTNE